MSMDSDQLGAPGSEMCNFCHYEDATRGSNASFCRMSPKRQEVFDWDRFKYDDKMGHAFLDLQPVAAATKLRRALQLTAGETKLRKLAPAADNCLLSESFVMYADGEIVLDARLRLRDVESGELFVTIKWIEADAR